MVFKRVRNESKRLEISEKRIREYIDQNLDYKLIRNTATKIINDQVNHLNELLEEEEYPEIMKRHAYFPYQNEKNYREFHFKDNVLKLTYSKLNELLMQTKTIHQLKNIVPETRRYVELFKNSKDWIVKIAVIEMGISSDQCEVLYLDSNDHLVNRKLVDRIDNLKFLKQITLDYLKISSYDDRQIDQFTFDKIIERIDDQNDLGDIAIWSSGDDPISWETSLKIMKKITDKHILARLGKEAIDIDVRKSAQAKLSKEGIQEDWNQIMWDTYNKGKGV